MRSRASHKRRKNNKKLRAAGDVRPGGCCTRKRKGKGSIVKISNVVFASVVAVLALVHEAGAVPSISVNGNVGAELAPPAGSVLSDSESGSPLARNAVSVADSLSGVWQYSALADIAVPKLAILGAIDNSSGGDLIGRFGGEIPLMRVNASLRDTIKIIAPSPDPYTVTAELVIDGSLAVSGSDGRVNVLLTMSPVDKLSNTQFRTYSSDDPAVNDILPIGYEFSGDAEFDLISQLFFFVSRVDAGANIEADFSNTAIINLIVKSKAGEIIPNVVIESDSGLFDTATPVPVPASLPLLLAGVLAIARQRRRCV